MDPLSLLCRLATSVPPPRYHTVRYAGVLAPASRWRARIAPTSAHATSRDAEALTRTEPAPRRKSTYRSWAKLLMRTFAIDVLECPRCKGRLELCALVTAPKSIARFLAALGEPTQVPERSPSRGPPYWKSTVLRRHALAQVA